MTQERSVAAESDELVIDKRGGVAFITMNRPKVLNARNRRLRELLADAFRWVDEDPSVTVAVLSGAGGRAFSVGMDIKEAAEDDRDVIGVRRSYGEEGDAHALARVGKPTIAAIDGYALGGGLELALCCDFRIASTTSQFGLPEARRGIMPGSGGTQRLPRLIGESKALEMLMTGESISAEEALRVGLVSSVVPSAELPRAAMELADAIAQSAPLAVRFIKAAVRRGQAVPLAEALTIELDLAAMLSQSADAREGLTAFAEKRAPVWTGAGNLPEGG
ncbi:MAG: enoyl-CoA hydratase/isomerase family protein [Actinobacteria bacterium]|nr:enoyl-CoA hydratase/isomerase family protein [Actinomycetota bacterium]